MTTNNQQGMTDETIREEIARKICDIADTYSTVDFTWGQLSKLEQGDFYEYADQIIPILSQHSASQEAEIKRLTTERDTAIKEVGKWARFAGDREAEIIRLKDVMVQLEADSQKRIEGIIGDVEPYIVLLGTFLKREKAKNALAKWWQSLKKRVRGDGT